MAIAANFPTVRPSILLDFSNQTVLDPRITFARTTTALYYDNKSAALAEQNLLLRSNEFTNAYWSVAGLGTPVLNATDPTGTASGAYTLTASVGSAKHYIQNTIASIGAATYTLSFYLQAGTNNFATIIATGASASVYAVATFNLTSGSVGFSQSGQSGTFTYVSNTIAQIGSTNWYRCSVTFTSSATQNCQIILQLNNTATPTYGSFGLQDVWVAVGTETLLVYGAQLEQRSSPTVYTATTATAVNTYTPTLQSAAINAPRFDYNPTTRESLGLLLEQASTNLALYSSDYTNAAWTKSATTITATADISPDGSQNASLIVLGTTSASRNIRTAVTYTAATYTDSVYLKYYGQQFVQLGITSSIYCNFDLQNGVAGTPVNSTVNIIAVGNGWYRCSITATATAGAGQFIVHASNSLTAGNGPAFAGNGFDGYLVWGAQVELAPSATSYIATVASAQTRTVDSASMTGTNFSSWYNYSGGTVYVEAASGNPQGSITNTAPFAPLISDGASTNVIWIGYGAAGIQAAVRINGVAVQSPSVQPPGNIAANTFYKTAWYFSAAGNGISTAGQTATTYSQAIVAPAVNQLNIGGAGYGASNSINGRIKKFAYYPLALTNTQIQSLSAN